MEKIQAVERELKSLKSENFYLKLQLEKLRKEIDRQKQLLKDVTSKQK